MPKPVTPALALLLTGSLGLNLFLVSQPMARTEKPRVNPVRATRQGFDSAVNSIASNLNIRPRTSSHGITFAKEIPAGSALAPGGTLFQIAAEADSLLDEEEFLSEKQSELAQLGVTGDQLTLLADDLLAVEELRLQQVALQQSLQLAQADARHYLTEELGEEGVKSLLSKKRSESAQSLARKISAFSESLSEQKVASLTQILEEASINSGLSSDDSFTTSLRPTIPQKNGDPSYLQAWMEDQLSRLEGEQAYLDETLSDPALREAAKRYYQERVATFEQVIRY